MGSLGQIVWEDVMADNRPDAMEQSAMKAGKMHNIFGSWQLNWPKGLLEGAGKLDAVWGLYNVE